MHAAMRLVTRVSETHRRLDTSPWGYRPTSLAVRGGLMKGRGRMTTPFPPDAFDLDVRIEECVEQVEVEAVQASGDCTDNGCDPRA